MGRVDTGMGGSSIMRIWKLVLFVVSTRLTAADDSKEKIKQKRSVENLLSQFSFNPFTPFPELLTTTLPKLKTGKVKSLKGKKFEVFVAVEQKKITTSIPALTLMEKSYTTTTKSVTFTPTSRTTTTTTTSTTTATTTTTTITPQPTTTTRRRTNT